LIGGSRTNLEIAQLSDFSRARAHHFGSVPMAYKQSGRGSHMKLVIATQSAHRIHNWSAGALTDRHKIAC